MCEMLHSIALQQVWGPWFQTRSETKLWPACLWKWEDFLAKKLWEYWWLTPPLPNYLQKDQDTSQWDTTVRKWIFFSLHRWGFQNILLGPGSKHKLWMFWIDSERLSGKGTYPEVFLYISIRDETQIHKQVVLGIINLRRSSYLTSKGMYLHSKGQYSRAFFPREKFVYNRKQKFLSPSQK